MIDPLFRIFIGLLFLFPKCMSQTKLVFMIVMVKCLRLAPQVLSRYVLFVFVMWYSDVLCCVTCALSSLVLPVLSCSVFSCLVRVLSCLALSVYSLVWSFLCRVSCLVYACVLPFLCLHLSVSCLDLGLWNVSIDWSFPPVWRAGMVTTALCLQVYLFVLIGHLFCLLLVLHFYFLIEENMASFHSCPTRANV